MRVKHNIYGTWRMNHRRTLILYGAVLFLAVILFLYYLFPEEKVIQHLRYNLHQTLPDCRVDIGKSRPAFPVALRLSDVTINRMDQNLFAARFVKIGRPILSFFSPGRTFSIKSKAYGGYINGKVTTTKNESVPSVAANFKVSGIQIGDMAITDQLLNGGISGNLEGTVTYDNSKSVDQADINLTLTNVTIPFTMSFLKLGDIHFTNVTIEGVLNRQDLSIKKCDAKGNQANARLSGVIVVKNPIESSLLSISGTILPHHELLKNLPLNMLSGEQKSSDGLPFYISGTFKKPVVELR